MQKDAYTLILEAIEAGVYKPGDRLVESELAERLGVSRTPVREALRRLPPATFGIALATEPAIAALMGMLLLHEQLVGTQWLAIACIMGAAMGSAITRPAAAAKAPAEVASAG